MTTCHSLHHVKVVFDVEGDGPACEKESLWAVPDGEGYRLDNIPFYVRGFALGDVVAGAAARDGAIACTGLLKASGHSTVRLWFAHAGSDVQRIRDELRAMGCASELDLPRLVAVDVPADVLFTRVKEYLEDGEQQGLFEYEEACLAQQPPSQ